MQTDATLLANKSQHCWAQHVASVCTACWHLLRVVGTCWMLLADVWNSSNIWRNKSQHFFCSVDTEAKPNIVGSICTEYPTMLDTMLISFLLFLLRFRKQNAAHLQRCATDSQQCRELLRPFKQNPQHMPTTRNNSQHCWADNVGSCCVRLHGP